MRVNNPKVFFNKDVFPKLSSQKIGSPLTRSATHLGSLYVRHLQLHFVRQISCLNPVQQMCLKRPSEAHQAQYSGIMERVAVHFNVEEFASLKTQIKALKGKKGYQFTNTYAGSC
jgi:hypothetical protein